MVWTWPGHHATAKHKPVISPNDGFCCGCKCPAYARLPSPCQLVCDPRDNRGLSTVRLQGFCWCSGKPAVVHVVHVVATPKCWTAWELMFTLAPWTGSSSSRGGASISIISDHKEGLWTWWNWSAIAWWIDCIIYFPPRPRQLAQAWPRQRNFFCMAAS